MQHLVDDQSECPNVSFRTVNIVNITLGRHVERRANIDIFELLSNIIRRLLGRNSKTEVCQLCRPLLQEDVGQFDVPMHDVFRIQIFETSIDIPHIGPYLRLTHRPPFFNELLQSSLLTKLSNKITVVNTL